MSGGKDIALLEQAGIKEKKTLGRKKVPRLTVAKKKMLEATGYFEQFEAKIFTEAQCVFLMNYKKNPKNIGLCCEASGISRQAFYSYMKQNEEFYDAYHDIEEEIKDKFEVALLEMAFDDKDLKAIQFYLTKKAGDRGYSDRQEVKINVAEDIEFIDVNEEIPDLDDSFMDEILERND